MLNLSDKELDRLARDAANEHDPGNLSDPGSWERLRLRLDKELGHISPNLFRSIRRMPFYYAPAILLLVGVSYYLIKQGRTNTRPQPPSPASAASTTKTSGSGSPSGSPPVEINNSERPATADGNPSTKNQTNTYQSTSTPNTADAADASGKDRLIAGTDRSGTAAAAPGHGDHAAASPGGSGGSRGSGGSAGSGGSVSSSSGGSTGKVNNQSDPANAGGMAQNSGTASGAGNRAKTGNDAGTANTGMPANGGNTSNGVNSANGNVNTAETSGTVYNAPGTADLQRSETGAPEFMALTKPVIDDSGLRLLGTKTVAKSADPIKLDKKKSSLNINKRLQLGFSVAPDFTSVNALSGDKPGSSIGITANYEFFYKWHLHTGVLLSRKNYTAAQQDYHVPYDYYRMNNLHDVYFVKGTINLIEIPLALRYDFSVAGNTVFFISGGVSSYLLTHENCNYYFDLFGREAYEGFNYNTHHASLFGTVDLSTGVETGISNTLSLMVAPYMKIPTSGMGFGQIQMSSIGIDFSLKYTPVLRRKRH